jgi:hypothetical protein
MNKFNQSAIKVLSVLGLTASSVLALAQENDLSRDKAPNAVYFEDYEYEYDKSRCLDTKLNGDCAFEYFYFTMSLGMNTGSKSPISVEQAARNLGFEAFDIEQGESGTPFKLAIGASLTDKWSLELGYTKLNEADLAFSTLTGDPDRFFDVARQVRPNKVKGWTFAALYSFYASESWYAYGKLGFYNHESEYASFDVFGDRQLESLPSKDGADLFFGLGASYKFADQFEANIEYERYKVEDNEDYILWLGLTYHFEE